MIPPPPIPRPTDPLLTHNTNGHSEKIKKDVTLNSSCTQEREREREKRERREREEREWVRVCFHEANLHTNATLVDVKEEEPKKKIIIYQQHD